MAATSREAYNGHVSADQASSARESGLAAGGLGSLMAAAGLVGVRGEIANANVALVLVLFVLLGAAIGGRSAGAVSALVAPPPPGGRAGGPGGGAA
jgi:hypothetical protein